MTPEQERLLEKANRSLQAARELNNTGFIAQHSQTAF